MLLDKSGNSQGIQGAVNKTYSFVSEELCCLICDMLIAWKCHYQGLGHQYGTELHVEQ